MGAAEHGGEVLAEPDVHDGLGPGAHPALGGPTTATPLGD